MKLDYNWIAGFVQADGTQHERDLMVLNRIIESMGCGTIVKPSSDRDRYTISFGSATANIPDLVDIVIPLFENNPIYGAKHKYFLGGTSPPPLYFVSKRGRGGGDVPPQGSPRTKYRDPRFLPGSIYYKIQRTFDNRRVKEIEGFIMCHEHTQKVLMCMWLFYFIFYRREATYSYLFFISEPIAFKVCRWLVWINLLLYHYLLKKLYIKFIDIFTVPSYTPLGVIQRQILSYKMYKKILCQPLPLRSSRGWMVNQQVRLSTFNNVTSETTCDITFKFGRAAL